MEPGSTLSQRSSFESTVSDDSNTQTVDLESARPLLPATPDTAWEKPGQRTSPRSRREADAEDDDEVLVIKGFRVGRGTILCGVAVVFLT